MKHIARRGFILLCTAAALTQWVLAGGFQLNEHGARAMGQGGAWAARAYDLSAIYFNPAGLASQHGMQFYLGSTIIVPKGSYFNDYNQETKMADQVFPPINLFASYQISDGLTAGIGVYNPFGLGTEWPDNWEGKLYAQKIDLQSFFISPTVAYQVMPELSVGVGVNYATGSVKLKGLPDTWHFASDPPQLNLALDATGIGFNFGVQYKYSTDVQLGFSYRSSVKMDATGKASFNPDYTSIPLPKGDASASLTLPSTFFIGASFKPMQNLELEADFQSVGWSVYKQLAINFAVDPTSDIVAQRNYEDSYIIRIGGEYTMGGVQLRYGYLFDKSPVPDNYVEPQLPDANRNGYNVGIGFKMGKTSFDFSYMYLPFSDRKVTNSLNAINGTYKTIVNLFGANVGFSL